MGCPVKEALERGPYDVGVERGPMVCESPGMRLQGVGI